MLILGVRSILNISCNLLLCLFFLKLAFNPLKMQFKNMTIKINTYPKYFVLYTLTIKQYLSVNNAITNNIVTIIIFVPFYIFQHLNKNVDIFYELCLCVILSELLSLVLLLGDDIFYIEFNFNSSSATFECIS
jgi:hypothetical protein